MLPHTDPRSSIVKANIAKTWTRCHAQIEIVHCKVIRGVPLEDFRQDRPREYDELVESGQLEASLMPAPLPVVNRMWRRFGFTALTIGLCLIGLVLYAMIFAYR